MPEPRGERDLSDTGVDEARVLCFGDADDASGWDRPRTALVPGRLRALIRGWRRQRPRIAGAEEDLYQEVYRDVWERFDAIWSSFRSSSRPQQWRSFESYLQVTIANSLGTALRRGSGKEALAAEDDAANQAGDAGGRRDAVARLDARRIFAAGFRALPENEREAFLDRHVRNRPVAETARRLGIAPGSLYKLRHRARERFRNQVVRIVAEDVLRLRGTPVLDGIVRERCSDGHPCFLYDLDCRLARAPDALAGRVGPAPADAVARALDGLAREIATQLEDHGVPGHLDSCFWEAYRSRAKTGKDHG
jgi:RNA polymerase sigma factor (sigma-70 family)